jgi:hypothetical protein
MSNEEFCANRQTDTVAVLRQTSAVPSVFVFRLVKFCRTDLHLLLLQLPSFVTTGTQKAVIVPQVTTEPHRVP